MLGTTRILDVDGIQMVVMRGEHCAATSLGLGGVIEGCYDHGSHVIVDMLDATFIDSTVLRGLMAGHRHTEQEPGDSFALVAAPGTLAHRVLQIVDLPRMIHTYPSREAALDALASVA